MPKRLPEIGRRPFLKGAAAAVAASTLSGTAALAAPARTIKIGLVGTKTGAVAIFYEGMPYIIDLVKKQTHSSVVVDGVRHPYEIIFRDSESSSVRASQVAQDLILNEQVDLMLAWSTPDTVNSVANQCEANGVPCISTVNPLESYYFGRGAPKDGFQWTYNFFWSAHEFAAACAAAWRHLPSNKTIGALWANGADGQAFAKICPPIFDKEGFKLVDPGRFDLPSNYIAQISAFKEAGVELVQGVLPPPQFTAFLNAAAQQRFRPQSIFILKAVEFAAPLIPLGSRADGLMVDIWWSPEYPYVSATTGISCKALAAGYEKATGKQWVMPLGMYYALFETALSALKKSESLEKAAIRNAIRSNTFHTTIGPIDFRKGPFPNTSATPLVVGQWWKGTKYPLTPVIEDNSLYPKIPVAGKLKPLTYS